MCVRAWAAASGCLPFLQTMPGDEWPRCMRAGKDHGRAGPHLGQPDFFFMKGIGQPDRLGGFTRSARRPCQER